MSDTTQERDMDATHRFNLAEPFALDAHKWRVLNITKDKQKASWYVYIDARDVAQRLDDAAVTWEDSYEVITMTDSLCVVQCALTVEGSTRTDAGSDSRQSNDSEGNYIKGAYSDAFKRAAVKFGIGRYLYSLESYYLPIDEWKRFTPDSEKKIRAHLARSIGTPAPPRNETAAGQALTAAMHADRPANAREILDRKAAAMHADAEFDALPSAPASNGGGKPPATSTAAAGIEGATQEFGAWAETFAANHPYYSTEDKTGAIHANKFHILKAIRAEGFDKVTADNFVAVTAAMEQRAIAKEAEAA